MDADKLDEAAFDFMIMQMPIDEPVGFTYNAFEAGAQWLMTLLLSDRL